VALLATVGVYALYLKQENDAIARAIWKDLNPGQSGVDPVILEVPLFRDLRPDTTPSVPTPEAPSALADTSAPPPLNKPVVVRPVLSPSPPQSTGTQPRHKSEAQRAPSSTASSRAPPDPTRFDVNSAQNAAPA
jgi:type IV secretory pathway VirB10-like protein